MELSDAASSSSKERPFGAASILAFLVRLSLWPFPPWDTFLFPLEAASSDLGAIEIGYVVKDRTGGKILVTVMVQIVATEP